MAETANTSGAAMQAPGWRRLLRQIDRNGERWLLLIFYTTIVVTITMEVIRRFVLSYSSIWGEEIARYAFIYLVWIGASAAVRERAHIRIDVLFHYISRRVQAMLYLLGEVLTLAAKDYEKNPPTLAPRIREYSTGIYRLDDQLLVVLDVDSLLDYGRAKAA